MPRTSKDSTFAGLAPDVVKSARKIANNTWTYSRDGARVIRLHRTDIVTRHPDGRVTLESGGYRSAITKDRMNGEMNPEGFSIFAKAGLWQVRRMADGATVPYYDGITIPDAFDGPARKAADKAGEVDAATAKAILRYVRKVRTMKELPLPGAGDCWLCMAEPEPANLDSGRGGMGHARDNGQSGRARDASHFREHIKELYVHGTLLVNALRWAGYQDSAIRYYLSQPPGRHARTSLCSAVRRYLRRKLAIG